MFAGCERKLVAVYLIRTKCRYALLLRKNEDKGETRVMAAARYIKRYKRTYKTAV